MSLLNLYRSQENRNILALNNFITGLIVFCFATVFVFSWGVPGLSSSELSVKGGLKVDLGTATEGQLKSGTLTLINTGNDPINVKNYFVTCNCLKVMNLKTGKLLPGETIEARLLFDTSGLGGKTSVKDVLVFSDTSNSPLRINVTVTVNERREYEVSSDEILNSFYLMVDLRPKSAYEKGHILGAVNIPLDRLESWSSPLPSGTTLYLYSEEGEKSAEISDELDNKLPQTVRSLIGGFEQWKLTNPNLVTQPEDTE